jgi:hypothetical protein
MVALYLDTNVLIEIPRIRILKEVMSIFLRNRDSGEKRKRKRGIQHKRIRLHLPHFDSRYRSCTSPIQYFPSYLDKQLTSIPFLHKQLKGQGHEKDFKSFCKN